MKVRCDLNDQVALLERVESMKNVIVSTKMSESVVCHPDISLYVQRFRAFAAKSAESFIRLAETLCEAEHKFTSDDFEVFCSEINLPKNSSTYKKLKKIGEAATRFKLCESKLPNAWTTLYQLSKLPVDDFERLVEDDVLTPFTTSKQITDYLTPCTSNEVDKIRDRISISGVAKLSRCEMNDLFDELVSIKNRYNVKLNIDEFDSMRTYVIDPSSPTFDSSDVRAA